VPPDTEPGPGRGETATCERHAVDVGRAVAAVTGEAQRTTVLRMLPRSHDGHGHRVTIDEVDRLIIESEAHSAPNTNPPSEPFPARSCRESRLGTPGSPRRMFLLHDDEVIGDAVVGVAPAPEPEG
jgi:hypothetical protein